MMIWCDLNFNYSISHLSYELALVADFHITVRLQSSLVSDTVDISHEITLL